MKKRILIAEDESIIAMDIRRILEKEGYEITSVAASALDVIEKAESSKPDVILMDIMLEGSLDGIEAAKIISYKHQVPIIFVTALKDKNTSLRANISGPTAYIVKPYDAKELIKTIDRILQNNLINNLNTNA